MNGIEASRRIMETLEQEGFRVDVADNGKQAVEKISSINEAGLRQEEEAVKTTAGDISPEELGRLLGELEPSLKKRQPKHCASVFEEIARYTIPAEYAVDLAELDKLVKRYKFKEAQVIFERLMAKISAWGVSRVGK